jgi:hypothetical protein
MSPDVTQAQSVIIRPRGARPSGREATTTIAVGAMFGLGAAVRLAAMRGQGRTSEAAAITAIAIAVVLLCWGLYFLYRTNASLEVSGGVICRTDALRRRTIIPINRLRVALRLSVCINVLAVPSPQLLFLGDEGRCKLRIYTALYDEQDLSRVCTAAGLPLTGSWDNVVSSRIARHRYPGSYSWWLAHPWVLAMAISVVLGAAAVAIAVR